MTIVEHTSADLVFGTIVVIVDQQVGRVLAYGDKVPQVQISRIGVTTDPDLPVGTRDPALLTMTVEGLAATITPAPHGLTRAGHKVRIESVGGHVLFAPCSRVAHRLIRGTAYGGDNEMGRLERRATGAILAEWSDDRSLFGVIPKSSQPAAVDASIGYALAAAFGTGAPGRLG